MSRDLPLLLSLINRVMLRVSRAKYGIINHVTSYPVDRRTTQSFQRGKYVVVKRKDREYDVTTDLDNTAETFDTVWNDGEFMEGYQSVDRILLYDTVAADLLGRVGGSTGPISVLDAGLGPGLFLERLARSAAANGVSFTLAGFDFSEGSVAICRKKLPDGDFAVDSIHEIHRNTDSYDVVVCMEVLEHIEFVARALAELLRITKPGGYVALTVPNGDYDNWIGHINFWSPAEFRAFAASAGHPLVDFRLLENDRTLYALIRKELGR